MLSPYTLPLNLRPLISPTLCPCCSAAVLSSVVAFVSIYHTVTISRKDCTADQVVVKMIMIMLTVVDY